VRIVKYGVRENAMKKKKKMMMMVRIVVVSLR